MPWLSGLLRTFDQNFQELDTQVVRLVDDRLSGRRPLYSKSLDLGKSRAHEERLAYGRPTITQSAMVYTTKDNGWRSTEVTRR